MAGQAQGKHSYSKMKKQATKKKGVIDPKKD
jgi:hypothetical protein